MCEKFCHALNRRKIIGLNDPESKLRRVLTLLDLTGIGVGSTLGLGVYVLAGSVAYNNAGPAVVISFLIAGIASALAGMCYAEFAMRVPQAGSAYVYSYVTIGEFVAFNIGWNLILEYVLGTAGVASGFSNYLDLLFGGWMSKHLREIMPIDAKFMAEYPDFFAAGVILTLTLLIALGVKESSTVNNILVSVNLFTIIMVVGVGSFYSDPKNWFIKKEDIPSDAINPGEGGFMPFGITGVMAGAATCFFAFVGFDGIATTGEEAINPRKNIPLALLITIIIIFLAYFGISTVLTMMVPYFAQEPEAPLLKAFEKLDLHVVKWIVTIGAIFALCSALIGALFPLPRIIYSMAEDGVIFRQLRIVNNFTKTPIYATILAGVLASVMVLLFDLHQLIDMMSIGTLLSYAIVAVCVLVLRYEIDDNSMNQHYQKGIATPQKYKLLNLGEILKHCVNYNRTYNDPTILTSMIVKVSIIIYSILILFLCLVLNLTDYKELYSQILLSIISIGILLPVYIIWRQPTTKKELRLRVPFVPFTPCLIIFINLYLMFQLDISTWIRFAVWSVVGFFIYFGYGIRYSKQGLKEAEL